MARRVRDLSVGAFASLALLVLAVGVMAVGGESSFFSDQVRYRVVFPDTQGLIVGSPVHMAGVQIGSVSDIRLPTDPRAPGIEVELTMSDRYTSRIREGSAAQLRVMAWLSGEKYVEISPGDWTAPVLAEGSVLPVRGQSEILQQGEDIAENLTEITSSLVDILQPLREGRGLFGEMIQDPEFGQASLEHLRGTLENLEAVTGEVRQGRGLAGRMLSDEQLAAKLDRLGVVVDDLASVSAKLRDGEGAIGELVREGAAGEQAVLEIHASAASLAESLRRIESGEGFVGRLVADREYADANAARIAQSLANIEEVTERVRRGEGTLGKLINDPGLYDDAATFVSGVNDSKFARWLLRRYRKRGIEAQERELEAAPAATPPTVAPATGDEPAADPAGP